MTLYLYHLKTDKTCRTQFPSVFLLLSLKTNIVCTLQPLAIIPLLHLKSDWPKSTLNLATYVETFV